MTNRPFARPAGLLVLLALFFGAVASTQGSETAARQLFEEYVALGHGFDARLADLYSDDAVITQARGNRNRFSNVRYTTEGARVRIRASRFSQLKNYTITSVIGASQRSADVLRCRRRISQTFVVEVV